MTIKELNFISSLISYKPLSCLFRVLIIGFIGLMLMLLTEHIANDLMPSMPYLTFSIGFIIITEVNVFFNHLIVRHGSEFMKEYQFTTHIILNTILIIGVISLLFPMIEDAEIAQNSVIQLSATFTLIFIAFVILTICLLRIIQNYIDSQHEIEVLRQAQSASEYQALVEQVNPHFLFNNLSVLKSLIMYDKDKAVDFTQNFTDIYRYVLQCKDKDVVLLTDELDFVNSYLALHKERIGEGLKVSIDIAADAKKKSIIPMGLQILVENALKHNIASKSEPLQITITAKDDSLIVTNNLNKKETGYSTHKGLDNVIKRYKILTDKKVLIQQTTTSFMVSLPLI